MFAKKKKLFTPALVPVVNNTIKDIGQNVVQGMAFGTGFSLADKMVSTIFNSSNPNTSNTCKELFNAFEICLNNNVDNTICKDLFEQFKKCEEKN